MKAGREMDMLVWQHVFATPGTRLRGLAKPYSTDIAAAWEVVEKIGHAWRGFEFALFWSTDHTDGSNGKWCAGWFEWGDEGPEGRAHAYSASVPEAICLAALTAVGAIEPPA